MSEHVINGLTLAFWFLLSDTIWLVLGATLFWDQLKVKKSTMLRWIVLVGLFMPLGACISRIVYGGIYYTTLTQLVKIIFYLLIVIFFLRGFEVYWAKLVFVFLFLQNVSNTINTVSLLVNTLARGSQVRISFRTTPTYPALIAVMNCIAFLILIRYFRNTLRPTLENLSKRDSTNMLGVPLLFLFINVMMNNVAYNTSDMFTIDFLYALTSAAGAAAYVLTIRLLGESGQRTRLEEQNRNMGQLLELQQRSFAQLADSIEQTSVQRHDMRFHLSVLSGYLEEKDYQKANEYLEQYSHGLEEHIMPNLCKNRAIDVLARHFIGQISTLGCQTDIRLVIPAVTQVPDAQLCVIFGNLFENALHELEKQNGGGIFSARCETREGTMVIAVDNTCASDIGTIELGLGLTSVTAVARKYGGTAQFECTNGTFRASVMLYF